MMLIYLLDRQAHGSLRCALTDPQGAPWPQSIAALGGLLFLHVPLLLIFLYAFTTEEKSFQFPPPGYTLKWFAVAWDRQDIWGRCLAVAEGGVHRHADRAGAGHLCGGGRVARAVLRRD